MHSLASASFVARFLGTDSFICPFQGKVCWGFNPEDSGPRLTKSVMLFLLSMTDYSEQA